MNISTLILILRRQFLTKWGRFLLASGGIMIGIWAIALTTSLSLGLQGTVIDAINSQSSARQLYIGKLADGSTEINPFDTEAEYEGVGQADIEKLRKIESLTSIAPDALFANNFLNLVSQLKESDQTCFEQVNLSINPSLTQDQIEARADKFEDECLSITINNFLFESFYENNRTNWIGKTELNQDEIVLCFRCNDFGKKLNANTPEELLGREIKFDYSNSPTNYIPGESYDLSNSSFGVSSLDETKTITLTIGAIIDDREDEADSFGPPSETVYIDPFYFDEAIKLGDTDLIDENIGYFQLSGYIDSYDNLDKVIEELKDEGYTALSFTKQIIDGISIAFTILTYVLSSLGIIAIIASIFGIINVMTISVLERKKEIGILKSLGSKDSDILKIFMIESASLGFIGWLMGTLLAIFTGFILTTILKFLIDTVPGWKDNLAVFGIENVSPIFPWWLIVGTLVLAIVATTISGLIPAIKASRQNPIDVLRSE